MKDLAKCSGKVEGYLGGTQEQDLFSGTKSIAIDLAYKVLNFLSISNADYLLIPETDAVQIFKQVIF